MKIEKVNDNQIRCTLTKTDLTDRQLKLSELAYGSEKAKSLFREMMQQAAYEYGFEAEDIPLMVEAIPLSTESIILIITKVDSVDELDTRFAKFAPSAYEDSDYSHDDYYDDDYDDEPEDDFFSPLDKLKDFIPLSESMGKTEEAKTPAAKSGTAFTRLYKFQDLDTVIGLAASVKNLCKAANSLYKNTQTGEYFLSVTKGNNTNSEFDGICNAISEYAPNVRCLGATTAYLNEQYKVIIKNHALETLREL